MALKDFADLKSLGKQLKEQADARAAAKAEQAKREKVQVVEANLFHASVGGVKRLPEQNRLVPGLPKAAGVTSAAPARPRTQAEDDAAVLRESLSDQFDVEHLLETEPNVSFTRNGVGPDVMRKLRKGHWPVQDELDLHGLRRDAARDAIGAFLQQAKRHNARCVAVIYGKGYGSANGEPVLRSMVHSWLEQKEEVIAFCAARPLDGGEGALMVLLRAALQTPR
jgi:DNA-nicking Smr family endonuclease